MIVHVWRRAIEAEIGPVLVAADEPAIVGPIKAVGGRAVLTAGSISRAPTGFSRR